MASIFNWLLDWLRRCASHMEYTTTQQGRDWNSNLCMFATQSIFQEGDGAIACWSAKRWQDFACHSPLHRRLSRGHDPDCWLQHAQSDQRGSDHQALGFGWSGELINAHCKLLTNDRNAMQCKACIHSDTLVQSTSSLGQGSSECISIMIQFGSASFLFSCCI